MPSVADGLGSPDGAENVNSDAGFEAALAAKTGRTDELEGREPQVSTSIADGLTEGTSDQPRDEAGKFAPKGDVLEPGSVPDEEDDTEEDAGDGGLSPEVQALLEKHDGDLEAALAEAVSAHKNAESVIGRQGSDLGQLKQEIAELRGEVRARAEQAPVVPQQQMSNDELEDMVAEHGGSAAALWAVNADREDLYERIHRIWKTEDPDAASEFRLDYKLWKQQQDFEARTQAAQPQAQPYDPQVGINESLDTFAKEVGEEWEALAPHMTPAVQQVPKTIAALLNSEDPGERLDAVRAVGDKARLLAGSSAGKVAAQKAATARTERVKAATVASGSLRPVKEPVATEDDAAASADRIKRFKEELLNTEDTSVMAGLTYGK